MSSSLSLCASTSHRTRFCSRSAPIGEIIQTGSAKCGHYYRVILMVQKFIVTTLCPFFSKFWKKKATAQFSKLLQTVNTRSDGRKRQKGSQKVFKIVFFKHPALVKTKNLIFLYFRCFVCHSRLFIGDTNRWRWLLIITKHTGYTITIQMLKN